MFFCIRKQEGVWNNTAFTAGKIVETYLDPQLQNYYGVFSMCVHPHCYGRLIKEGHLKVWLLKVMGIVAKLIGDEPIEENGISLSEEIMILFSPEVGSDTFLDLVEAQSNLLKDIGTEAGKA